MNSAYLKAKSEIEIIPITWIIDRPVVSATADAQVEIGIDPDPNGVLGFGPMIDNQVIVQYIQGGIAGNTYKISLVAQLLDNTVMCTTAYIPVVICGQ